jgi:hypothetical protein
MKTLTNRATKPFRLMARFLGRKNDCQARRQYMRVGGRCNHME